MSKRRIDSCDVQEQNMLKPFVKWVGGKGQLINELEKYITAENEKPFSKYAEPMVGGGALFFNVLNKFNFKELYISDINVELINAYIAIKNNIDALVDNLLDLQTMFLSMNEEGKKVFYYHIREKYNSLLTNDKTSAEKAAYFIFLNKTCFNGLYRVNRYGQFNVPMGEYKNPKICDEANLRNIHKALQNVTIACGDYTLSKNFIDRDTFVYVDPPYRPISITSAFTSYNSDVFDDNEQIRLAQYIDEINKIGAKIVLSNSDPQNINPDDTFFDDLYKNYKICRVEATRMINSNSAGRGKIKELLISNYRGESNMRREFTEWLKTFKASICNYDYYVNFNKVYGNVDNIKVELNILNSLIGSKDIEKDFIKLLTEYPKIIKCIPILLAVRSHEIYAIDADGEYTYKFNKATNTPTEYAMFMKKTGLFELISNRIIRDLYDYVTGVEVGLDSNGRKNRGGHLMEDLVEDYLIKMNLKPGVDYFKEMYVSDIQRKWGLNLANISNQGKMEKRFDFVVKKSQTVYAIETNFYTGGGSKLNETARSYKTLALESQQIDGFAFVWITDGVGWKSARHNLEETFDVMDNIFCIADLENGALSKLFV